MLKACSSVSPADLAMLWKLLRSAESWAPLQTCRVRICILTRDVKMQVMHLYAEFGKPSSSPGLIQLPGLFTSHYRTHSRWSVSLGEFSLILTILWKGGRKKDTWSLYLSFIPVYYDPLTFGLYNSVFLGFNLSFPFISLLYHHIHLNLSFWRAILSTLEPPSPIPSLFALYFFLIWDWNTENYFHRTKSLYNLPLNRNYKCFSYSTCKLF